jgi:hypothetical protein
MRQRIMAAAAAIGVLGLGSIAAIEYVTIDRSAPTAAPAEGRAAAAIAPPAPSPRFVAAPRRVEVTAPLPVAPRPVAAAPSIPTAYLPGPPTIGAAVTPDSIDPREVQNLAYGRSYGRGGGGRR